MKVKKHTSTKNSSTNVLASLNSQNPSGHSNDLTFKIKKAMVKQFKVISLSGGMKKKGFNIKVSPQKNMKDFIKADMNDFTKGISDLKVSYEPYFGHSSIDY
jgi:hypothetical protein